MTAHSSASADPRSHTAVRVWLHVLAGLVVLMVLVGGMTRLTDSGLSITEWRPVTGAIPPLSEAAWTSEFAKYQATPQYRLMNHGMSLDEFKTIYWWEWGHRFLGRLIGVVFAVPFLWFLIRRQLPRRIAPGLAGIFLLGGIQGAIGWWMVASGLVERTSVAPYRLAVHLTMAFLIFAGLLWVARSLKPAPEAPVTGRLRWGAGAVLVLAFVQVALGALVAGLDAGRTFTTWPLIDGGFVPPAESLLVMKPAWINLFENPLTTQFNHRLGAYALFALAAWHAFDARHAPATVRRRTFVVFVTVLVQAVIGIVTLVHAAPLWLALLHQFGALGVIAHATLHYQALLRAPLAGEARERAGEPAVAH